MELLITNFLCLMVSKKFLEVGIAGSIQNVTPNTVTHIKSNKLQITYTTRKTTYDIGVKTLVKNGPDVKYVFYIG